MKGLILFTSQYGSTADYASWISEATGLPTHDLRNGDIELSDYDFLVLGSPIYYFKPKLRKWIERHLATILNKPVFFFTVSGAGDGEKLRDWLVRSLPQTFISYMQHVALRGRMNPSQLSFFHRAMLKIGSLFNKDLAAKTEELQGFNYVDKASIAPLVGMINKLLAKQAEMKISVISH